MTTDYSALASGDPGGELQTAYETMKAETVSTLKTLTGNELRIWAAQNPADYQNIKTAADTNVAAEMALALMQTPDSILEMGKPEVAALVGGLHQYGLLSDTGKAALEAMATIERPLYPGLTQAQLEKARVMRMEGRA